MVCYSFKRFHEVLCYRPWVSLSYHLFLNFCNRGHLPTHNNVSFM